MRLAAILALATLAFAQPPDPYVALRARDYDTAIPQFLAAIAASPRRADLRKDLAYTYLKTGEPVLARNQFREAAALDPADTSAALEYAFLCYETKLQAEARRTFDRLRNPAQGPANPTAETAFQNIDRPLAAGIDRWQKAIALGGDNFSAHFELATLAEQRDDLPLAATHYQRAWRMLPDRRTVLVDLGRVWQHQHLDLEANAALLAASRGGEPYAAELAREMLPARYPFVPEFRAALKLDPANHELRRELAYLLLRMSLESDAEAEFRILVQNVPGDLLSATQLGFLLYARGETIGAQLLFDRVLAGPDDDLANRVRAVLRMTQVLRARNTAAIPTSIDAKVMAERSLKAGYMKDALKYLEVAQEADPGDFDVMLKLGWANNILHRDAVAVRWFDLARRSSDPKIAADATRGYRALFSASRPVTFSLWVFPSFSTRWHDAFGYGQVKLAFNLGVRVHPYVSARVIGDRKGQSLSENSVIFALGLATDPWRGITAWGEAGEAVNYITGALTPDYRGGINLARTLRHNRWFAATTLDALYISRFGHDFLAYSQTRAGYGIFNWNLNVTADVRRQDWANFVETGPGLRIPVAESFYLTFNALRGRYLIESPSRAGTYNDFRAGFWYAFTR